LPLQRVGSHSPLQLVAVCRPFSPLHPTHAHLPGEAAEQVRLVAGEEGDVVGHAGVAEEGEPGGNVAVGDGRAAVGAEEGPGTGR
jgi:hypothetical protein